MGAEQFGKSYVNGKFVRATELSAKQAKKIRQGAAGAKTARAEAASINRLRSRFGGDPVKAESPGQFGQSRGANGNRRDGVLANYRDTMGSGNPDVARMNSALKNPGAPAGSKDLTEAADASRFHAFTRRMGGKSGGKSYVYTNPNARDYFVNDKGFKRAAPIVDRHEHAHADVKRSEYRLHGQIGMNPTKLGREEGRADYLAAGYYKGKGHKMDKYGQAPTGYSQQARGVKATEAFMREVGSSKKEARMVTAQPRGYIEVQDKMKRAGTKVRKMDEFAKAALRRPNLGNAKRVVSQRPKRQASPGEKSNQRTSTFQVESRPGLGFASREGILARAQSPRNPGNAFRFGGAAKTNKQGSQRLSGVAGRERRGPAPISFPARTIPMNTPVVLQKSQEGHMPSNPFYRDDQGRFVSPYRPKVEELGPQMLGHGFEQTEESVEAVEKADTRPQRGQDAPYTRRDAKELVGYGAAAAGLGGASGALDFRAARKSGTKGKGSLGRVLRGRGAFVGGLGALGGAAAVMGAQDLKRGGTKQHRFSDPVKKNSPDMADVEIKGVLRPLPRAKKRRG